MLIGISAAIGMSDKGQLSVGVVISERKENATPEEQESLKNVSDQQQPKNTQPNSGLVGSGKSPAIAPPVITSTTTDESSSSTEAAASSSEESAAVTEEVVSDTQPSQEGGAQESVVDSQTPGAQ